MKISTSLVPYRKLSKKFSDLEKKWIYWSKKVLIYYFIYSIYLVLTPADVEVNIETKMHRCTLKMNDQKLEKQYIQTNIKEFVKTTRIIIVILLVIFGVYVLIQSLSDKDSTLIYVRIGTAILYALLFILIFNQLFEIHYYKIMNILCIIALLLRYIFAFNSNAFDLTTFALLFSCITSLIFNLYFVQVFLLNILNMVGFYIRFLFMLFFKLIFTF